MSEAVHLFPASSELLSTSFPGRTTRKEPAWTIRAAFSICKAFSDPRQMFRHRRNPEPPLANAVSLCHASPSGVALGNFAPKRPKPISFFAWCASMHTSKEPSCQKQARPELPRRHRRLNPAPEAFGKHRGHKHVERYAFMVGAACQCGVK